MSLYNNTNHSVLLVGLFHSSFDATTAQCGFAGQFTQARRDCLLDT
jgi:hypothetical protein